MSRRLLAEVPILAASAFLYLALHGICFWLTPTWSGATLAGERLGQVADHLSQILVWPGSLVRSTEGPGFASTLIAAALNMTLWAGAISLLVRPIVKRRLELD